MMRVEKNPEPVEIDWEKKYRAQLRDERDFIKKELLGIDTMLRMLKNDL